MELQKLQLKMIKQIGLVILRFALFLIISHTKFHLNIIYKLSVFALYILYIDLDLIHS